ncbi:MAG: amidophosphoribosyltransferase, partial [Clostridia bacterium]|nr:amidophosphoribosyltransferase [Clostridia bacterium]
MFGNIHEECGVFGIFDPTKKIDVTHITYSGLYALQHRGQQSCGIAVNNEGKIYNHNDEGLLNEVFNEMILNYLKGNIALGHVRYASSDNRGRENNLPYVSKYTKGQIAISYNGSLVNANTMRSSLEDSGAMFHTNSDAEIFAYMISRERLKTDSTEQAILNIMPKVSGAYSFSIMTPNKLIGVRDPKGFRPLCIGTLKG